MTDMTAESTAVPGPDAQDRPNPAGAAKQMLGDAGRAVKDEAAQFADVAQQRARGVIDQRKETATRTLGDFADAIRKAGDELNTRDQSMASRLVGQAADSLEGLSRSVAGKRPEELLDAVRDFGRRNPAAFIGGSVLLGLAIGRFARSSAQVRQDTTGTTLGDGGGEWARNETWAEAPAESSPSPHPAAFGASETGVSGEPVETGALSQGGELERRVGASDIEDESDTGTGEGTGRAAGYGSEI